MAKKSGLSDRLSNINKKKDVAPVVPKPVIQEARVPKKQGRPTYKKAGVNYEKIFTMVPEEIKEQLDILRVTKFRGKVKTQSELILIALEEFIEKNK